MTPKDIFAEMPSQLDQNAAKGVNATIQFNLSGENGGQWYVAIKDGTAAVSEGTAPSANMTRPMSPEIFSLPLMKAIWPLSLPVVMST